MKQTGCSLRGQCGSHSCRLLCRNCYKTDPTKFCNDFKAYSCNQNDKPPYVCNGCTLLNKCILSPKIYSAQKAHRRYQKELSESRRGVDMTPEELQHLDQIISPLVMLGQPLSHIFATHKDDIPVSRRTLYNYFDKRVFQAKNIDLPRKVRYKKRKKKDDSKRTREFKQEYRNRRTYKDFEHFMEAHPDFDVVEMDTVKGSSASGKCLLTLFFRKASFMVIILLPRCTQKAVINALDELEKTISLHTFRKSLPVILTDNGSEFKDVWRIENNADGKRRTYVFYCDPYMSNQKSRIEKNHEYIRYVIPKGRSMQKFTQDDISRMARMINSTSRDSLNGKTPFDLAELLLDKRIPASNGQYKIPPDHVVLKPVIVEHSNS